ncbi:MAG: glycine cleavage system protein H [Proteobacteria bacterium]|nr:glycine cleavage system protein H [Pseudomonadota bacterium]MBU0989496.1 glycine cleavage system protein H [Pseudomonadota bacterium]MBU1903850.1 glycine cleavage system protein H [Pseudomonadota bacterium]
MAEFKGITLPDHLYYDPKEHSWAKVEDGKVRVGLDAFGVKATGGNTQYVKLKPAGAKAIRSKPFGSIEAGKYIGPLRAPVSGNIAEVNQKVVENPTLVNTDPYGDGFFVVIEASSLEEELNDLVSGGENIQKWLEEEYENYKAKGTFEE